MVARKTVVAGGFLQAVLCGCLLTAGRGWTAVRYVDPPDTAITNDGLVLTHVGSQILFQQGTVYRQGIDEYISYAGGIYGDAEVAIQPVAEKWLVPLVAGDAVGGHLPWSGLLGRFAQTQCGSGQTAQCSSTGPWVGTERFVALRFRDSRGAVYYGWARVGHPGGQADGAYAPMLLYDFAVEDLADLPILAGSRRSLPDDLILTLRTAGGMTEVKPADVALLDRAGASGTIDLPDAGRLAAILAGRS